MTFSPECIDFFFVSSLNCRSNCGIGDIKKNWLCMCVSKKIEKQKKSKKHWSGKTNPLPQGLHGKRVFFWTTDEWEGRWGVQGDQITLVMSAASSSCWQQIVCHRLSSSVIWWQTWVSTKQAWSQSILVTSSPPVCKASPGSSPIVAQRMQPRRTKAHTWPCNTYMQVYLRANPSFIFHSLVKPQL